MKLISSWLKAGKPEGEVIALFGQAKLVKYPAGNYELVGGSKEHRDQAREWISLFFHEAVLTVRNSDRSPGVIEGSEAAG